MMRSQNADAVTRGVPAVADDADVAPLPATDGSVDDFSAAV